MKTMRCSRLLAALIVALTLFLTPAFAVEQEQTNTPSDTQTEQVAETQEAAAEAEEADPLSDPRVWAVLVVMFGMADVIYMKQKKKKEHR